MHVDRHEVNGAKVRLYNGDGYIEMDAAEIRGFDVEESPQPPAPPAAAAAPPAPTPTPGAGASTPAELADAAADRYGLERRLVRSLMAAESGFQQKSVSPKGAIGLMQLMPGTAKDLGADPHDPAQNVDAGARHLRDLLLKYDRMLRPALAAYNAGEGAVEKYRGIPPYSETINYIKRIEKSYLNPGN